jgi:hypothetical protein
MHARYPPQQSNHHHITTKNTKLAGINPIYTPVMWKSVVLSRIHIFLWLLANNKTLTRTNLAKRQKLDDMSCLFCNEQEDVRHLFFDCCVAKWVWNELSELLEFSVGNDFESIGKSWLSNKQFKTVNVLTSAALWTVRKIRNEMCFQGSRWTGTGMVLRRLARMLLEWKLLHKGGDTKQLERWAKELERRFLPPRLQ